MEEEAVDGTSEVSQDEPEAPAGEEVKACEEAVDEETAQGGDGDGTEGPQEGQGPPETEEPEEAAQPVEDAKAEADAEEERGADEGEGEGEGEDTAEGAADTALEESPHAEPSGEQLAEPIAHVEQADEPPPSDPLEEGKSFPADLPSPPEQHSALTYEPMEMQAGLAYNPAASSRSSSSCTYVDFHLEQQAPLDMFSDNESGVTDIECMDVGERLYFAGCGAEQRKQALMKQERESKVLNELSKLSQPRITFLGKKQPSRTDEFRSTGVSEMYKERLEIVRLRRKQLEEENIKVQMQGVSIAPESKRIVEQKGYKGPITGWDEQATKHFRKQQGSYTDPYDTFIPNINREKSPVYGRSGEVFTRLHTDAFKKTEMGGRSTTPPKRNSCGGITFISQSEKNRREKERDSLPSPSVRSDATQDFVVHRLLSAGQEKERRRAKVTAEMESAAEKKYSYQPSLNGRSLELAEERRRRKEKVMTGHTTGPMGKVSPQQVVAHKSKLREGQRVMEGVNFLQRNEKQLMKRRDKSKTNAQQKIDRELEHCTFTPMMNPTSEALLSGRAQSTGREYIQNFTNTKSTPGSSSPSGVFSRTTVSPSPHISPPSLAPSPFDRSADAYTTALSTGNIQREIDAVLDEWNKLS